MEFFSRQKPERGFTRKMGEELLERRKLETQESVKSYGSTESEVTITIPAESSEASSK